MGIQCRTLVIYWKGHSGECSKVDWSELGLASDDIWEKDLSLNDWSLIYLLRCSFFKLDGEKNRRTKVAALGNNEPPATYMNNIKDPLHLLPSRFLH